MTPQSEQVKSPIPGRGRKLVLRKETVKNLKMDASTKNAAAYPPFTGGDCATDDSCVCEPTEDGCSPTTGP